MSGGSLGFGRLSAKRRQLIEKLVAWKSAEENPIGEDGKPAPLRAWSLKYTHTGVEVDGGAVDAKMDPATLADKILATCVQFAGEFPVAQQVFMLEPFFGTDRIPSRPFPIQVTPQPQFDGPDAYAAVDLRNPQTQAATVLGQAIRLTETMAQLVGGGMQLMLGTMERNSDRQAARIEKMEADRERVWSTQQDLLDRHDERDAKRRMQDIQISAMEMAASKLLGYMPVLTARLDQYMVERFGIKDQDAPERTFLRTVLSRLDEEKVKKLIEIFGLTPGEFASFQAMGHSFAMDDKRKQLAVEAEAARRGLAPIVPFAPRRLAAPAS